MHLINTATCQLESTECMDLMHGLEYAILSHRWTQDEVLYMDMKGSEMEIQTKLRYRAGFAKILGACAQARKDGLKYIWIDTCCIDKNSSAELSEAINSMYRYYQEAKICYAYLVGLPCGTDPYVDPAFENHEWFQRGWTLQELIAPKEVIFYTDNDEVGSGWTELGRKSKMCARLSQITNIDAEVLSHTRAIQTASVAKRMSWAARRKTSRVEDCAYCLMGLFGVNMPMIYGEGPKAFIRLQEEIMRESSDESLFAWRDGNSGNNDDSCSANGRERGSVSSSATPLSLTGSSNENSAETSKRNQEMRDTGILASSPDAFRDSGHFYNYYDWEPRSPFFSTNRGLQITLYLRKERDDLYIAALNCPRHSEGQQTNWGEGGFTGIYLRRVTDFAKFGIPTVYDQFVRIGSDRLWAINQAERRGELTTIYVQKTTVPPTSAVSASLPIYPEHIVQLDQGPPCPPQRTARIQVRRGYRLYGTMGVKPSTQLPLKNQDWIPKMLQRAFQVPKEPGRLAAVVVFKRMCDDTSFTVLLGTCPSDAGGVTAHILNGCDEGRTFGRWAQIFAPKQDPTALNATVKFLNETVHVSIESRAENGKMYFLVDVHIDENPMKESAEPQKGGWLSRKF